MNLKSYLETQQDKPLQKIDLKKIKNKSHSSESFNKLTSKAKHLCRLYLTEKSHGTYLARVPTSKRVLQLFQRLANKIELHEKETKAKVNLFQYIQAHFLFFGKKTAPSYLNTKFSMKLYRTHEQIRLLEKQIIKEKPLLNEAIILRYVARARNESEREVLQQVKKSRLFSKKFLSVYGIHL